MNKPLRCLLIAIPILLGVSTSATAQIIYADDFNRANGVLGNTSTGSHPWLTPGGTTSTDPATNTTFLIDTNRFTLRSPNNHANRQAYVDFNLDTTVNYSVSFSLTTGTFATGASMLLLPRAQGTDIVGNTGWMLTRGGIFQYAGGARASGSISTTGTSIRAFADNTAYTFRIDVSGNTASLFVDNPATANSTLNLGSVAGNGTADSFMFGYNQIASSQRNVVVFVDDFAVVPEPGTFALLAGGLLVLVGRRRRRLCGASR